MSTMLGHAIQQDRGRPPRGARVASGASSWFGVALGTLGLGLAVNSLLGPIALDAIRYPFSGGILNQLLGLDAVSLVLVAPLCVLAGVLALRRHPAGPVLALGPATYTAYMFVQYVVGPQYLSAPRILPLHLGLFILSIVVTAKAWSAIIPAELPSMTPSRSRRRGVIVVGLAAFVASRYAPVLLGSWTGEPIAAEFRTDPSFFWTILLMDVGVVVPAAVATAVALVRRTPGAARAMYGLVGWFALVPPSVAAMSVAMILKDDPNATSGGMVVFIAAAALFAAFAVGVFRPLFARSSWSAACKPTADGRE
jgi:hypothetical protein